MKTDQYITASNLAEEFHVGKEFLSSALKGLTPVFSRPFGRGNMVVYNADEARDAVRKALAKRDRESVAKREAVKQAAVQQVDMSHVLDQLNAIHAAVAAISEDVKNLRAAWN